MCAGEKKARIRGNVERILFKVVEFFIHGEIITWDKPWVKVRDCRLFVKNVCGKNKI